AEAETATVRAETRSGGAAVAGPEFGPVSRGQERVGGAAASRGAGSAEWAGQAQPRSAGVSPGCGFEASSPGAYYGSNREADRRVRPSSSRAAISWLEGAVNLEASQLRAVVAGCGESRVDEYRVSFTARNSNDVYYGCVWPSYGREEDSPADEGQPDVVDEIAASLK
ncbi:hypothetical protein OY671_011081, partial [Metschnikowia pulcherrima]